MAVLSGKPDIAPGANSIPRLGRLRLNRWTGERGKKANLDRGPMFRPFCRNQILNRQSTPSENEFLKKGEFPHLREFKPKTTAGLNTE
jgi:hypothetical protein